MTIAWWHGIIAALALWWLLWAVTNAAYRKGREDGARNVMLFIEGPLQRLEASNRSVCEDMRRLAVMYGRTATPPGHNPARLN